MPRSPKLQRLTAMAVPALLAANAMVLVLGLSVMDDANPASSDTDSENVTYIKSADGTLRLVDPTTPEGRKAIADADQRGEQITTAPEGEPTELLQQADPSTTLAPPALANPIGDLLEQTESTVVDTLDQLGDTVDGVVDDLTDVIDDTAGTNLGDTVDPLVDETTDTLTTTVSTVVTTVTTAPALLEPVTEIEPITETGPITETQPIEEVVPATDGAPTILEDPLAL